MGRKALVSWTPEEEDTLVKGTINVWSKAPEKGIGPTLINIVQCALLPKERHKVLVGTGNCGNVYIRAVKEAVEITTLMAAPPVAPPPEIQFVERPVDVDMVLGEISLPRLEGVVAARRAQALLDHQEALVAATLGERRPAKKTPLPDLGITDERDVTVLYPKVCLVGIDHGRAHVLKTKLARMPLSVEFIVHGANPRAELLPLKAAKFFVLDTNKGDKAWKDLVNKLVQGHDIGSEQVIRAHGLDGCSNALQDKALEWRKKHPDLAALHDKRLNHHFQPQ